jgi:hypothetical protein
VGDAVYLDRELSQHQSATIAGIPQARAMPPSVEVR